MTQLASPDAPINRGNLAGVKRGLLVLCFPAVVYVAFVFYGGQRAAYQARHGAAVRCPHCGEGDGLPGSPCNGCGQTIP